MILMSPPCQPFTRLGKQLDIDDNRTDALKHICSLLPQCTSIEYILMENVRGFETSRARDQYLEAINSAGFYVQEFILSPTQFGIPNTRNRYYCLARRKKPFSIDCNNTIMEELPKEIIKYVNRELNSIRHIMQPEKEIAADFYLSDKVLCKRVLLMDIVGPESTNTICFTKAYTHYAEGTGSVYTALRDDYVKHLFDQLHQVPEQNTTKRLELLRRLRLRYFTPNEVARLMCFPKSFSFPADISDKQKYRLLGNSINVLVVGELIKLLCDF